MKRPQQEIPRDERTEALHELFTSDSWRNYVIPGLARRREALSTQIAASRNMTIEQIRWLQAEWSMIDDLLQDPKRFCSDEGL